nr:DUF3362 domain-containing protein [Clostridia bacterium]
LKDAIRLAQYLKSIGYMPEQVQDFYPTPSTKSTCMYYTGINPDTMQPVYVAKTKKEKTFQRALMQYRKKSNYEIISQALKEAGREDLIGFGEECLIKPTKEQAIARSQSEKRNLSKVGRRENVKAADKRNSRKDVNKAKFNNKKGGRKV